MSKKFKIPWILGYKKLDDESYMAAHNAADKHAKQLSKALSDLFVARDLAETLRGYLGESHINECFTAESIVDLYREAH